MYNLDSKEMQGERKYVLRIRKTNENHLLVSDTSEGEMMKLARIVLSIELGAIEKGGPSPY